MCILENSGLVGLALIAVISEAFLQRLEDKAIQEALTTNLSPLTYERYVHDIHTRFQAIQRSHSFLNILNKQNKAIQYTIEKENQSQELIRCYHYKQWYGKYEFKIHGKNAITNVQIKPDLFVNVLLIETFSKSLYPEQKSYVLKKISKRNQIFLWIC